MVKSLLRWFFGTGIFLTASAPLWSVGFTISGATVTLTGATQLSTIGDALLANGSLIANTSPIVVGGSWTITSGSFVSGTSTVTFNAVAAGQRITSNTNPFANIVFSGAGGYWTLQDSMTVLSNITLTAGTLDTGAGNNFGMAVAGDWTNNGGTFIPNQSTVTFNGAAASTSTWRGSTTFYSIQCAVPGKTLISQAAFVQTVTGSLTLMGGVGNPLRVRSTSPGSFAYMTNTGTNTVAYVDAEDNNAGGGNAILAGGTSMNSGHNVNWNFGHIAPSNALIALVSASNLNAAWDSVDSEKGYSLEASTASDFSGVLITSMTPNGNGTVLLLPSNLLANTTYYVRVGALWNDGTTNYTDTVPASTSTLTHIVTDSQIVSIFATTATVQWSMLPAIPSSVTAEGYVLQASVNSDFTGTLISSSTTNMSLSTLTVTGLTPETAYYFRVGAFNWGSVASFAPAVSAVTASDAIPRQPDAVWGFLNSVGDLFALSWHAVTLDINGLATTLDHYLIERSDSLGSDPSFTATVAPNTLSYAQTTGGETYYYRVTAVGANGIASAPSDYVDSTLQANRYVLAEGDAATRLVIPSDLSLELLKENNLFGDDVVLQLIRRTQDENASTLRSYDVTASMASTQETVSGFSFLRAAATFQIDLGSSPGAISPILRAAGSNNQSVAVYWNNGQRFIPITSPAPASGSSVTVGTRNAGLYQVRTAAASSHFQLTGGSPYPRVISPNAANNRVAFFFFDNPTGAAVTGSIYDMEGAKVVDLNASSQSPTPNALSWDGKNDNGTVVRSGVYLYKIQAGGDTLTGALVVAR